MYTIFFIIGIGFVGISFLLGAVADTEVGGPLSFLQPKLIAMFLLVTGGIGLILTAADFDWFFSEAVILAISISCGVVVAGVVHRFVIVPLRRAQNTSTYDKQATIGTWATIISPIPQGGYGKIRYSISGSTVTSPAKSEDGGEINNGENVAIVYIEGSTYFVRREIPLNTN